jgi:hypothetical protein
MVGRRCAVRERGSTLASHGRTRAMLFLTPDGAARRPYHPFTMTTKSPFNPRLARRPRAGK